MAYYFDHKHEKTDNPAASVDKPMAIFAIWLIILVGVIATIGVSFAHLGDASLVVHMLISVVQVSLVAYFWMHLNKADSLTWLTALSSIFIMMILFALPLSDYLTRYIGGL